MCPTHDSLRFESHGVDKSWTDAVTNAVMLYGMDSIDYIKWYHNRNPRINKIIPQFLHEYTHYWCFHSLVGTTLSLLRIRAMLRCAFSTRSDKDLQIGEDLYSYQTATLGLKPITEGLALFSEFDLTPGKSKMMTMTLSALVMAFGFSLDEDDILKRMNYAILALLQNTRFKQEFLNRRKANIYFQPFDCDEAYLPGYLAIKTLHTFLMQRISEFEDREVFLAYLRSFFFDDPILVNLLLNEEIYEIEKAQSIANRINSRVRWLIGNLSETDVRDYIEYTLSGDIGPFTKGIDVDEKTAIDSYEKITLVFNGLKEEINKNDEMESLTLGTMIAAIYNRRFIVIASTRVNVDVDECGKYAITSEIDHDFKMSIEVQLDLEKTGELLIVMPSAANNIVEVLSQQNGAFILNSTNSLNDIEKKGIIEFVELHNICQGMIEELGENLSKWIDESWVKIVLDHIKRQSIEFATDMYLTLSTLFVRDTNLKYVKKKLLENGLKQYVNNDPDVACTLGAIGLINTFSSKPDTVCNISRDFFGIDEDIFKRAINSLLEQKQFPMIYSSGDNLQALC